MNKNGGNVLKEHKNERSGRDRNLLFYLLITQTSQSTIHLLLISVVLARPEVLNLLGLQPFVDYVTYGWKFEGYKNLVTQQLWDLDFEVYYFQMFAASILIAGIFATITFIWLTVVAVLFPGEFYYQTRPVRKQRLYSTYVALIGATVFIPFFLFYNQEQINIRSKRYEILIYTDVMGWILFVWLWGYCITFVYMFTMMVKRGHSVGKNDNSSR